MSQDFASFCQARGLIVDRPYMDARIHAVPTTDKRSRKNGRYMLAGDWGWCQNWATMPAPAIWKPEGPIRMGGDMPRVDMTERLAQVKAERAAAAQRAREIVASCRPGPSPYLAKKGFPDEPALIDPQGFTVVPMRRFSRYESIVSVQWIDDDGAKKFLPGGATKGACFALGSFRGRLWLAEGLATCLAIRAGLRAMYQPDTVVCCFSAGNLQFISELIDGEHEVRIVADHDASQTGQRAAASTGHPWVMPDAVGTDMNDLMQTDGIYAVTDLLRRVM